MSYDDTLQFDAVLRRQHFADFSKVSQKRVVNLGRLQLVYTLAYGLVAFVATLAFLRAADHVAIPIDYDAMIGPGELVVFALVFGMVMSLVLWTAIARAAMSRYLERGFREGGSYLGARHYTLDARGIAAEGRNGYSLTLWTAVLEMTEAPDTVLLWTDPVAAVMVPKDAFATAEARERFNAFVAARLAANKT